MVSSPTLSAFELLLFRLDPDTDSASAKYEDLRVRVTRIFQWKGCPDSEADALADLTLDRIAAKLSQGENIENVNAYAAAVVRFVWLEHQRKRKEDAAGDDLPEVAVQPDLTVFDDADERMRCLRKCMAEIAGSENDRRLILGYYDTEAGGKNKDNRRQLAEIFGISMSALKVRACRIRARLEACINDCVNNVTESGKTDTYRQEGM